MTDIDLPVRRSRPPRLYAALLAMIGLMLAGGGVWLAWLGGSPYYLLAGLMVSGSAILLWRGRREGIWLYAAMLVGTLGWAVWESGFDGWALSARLIAPFVLGIWLLTPWLRRRLSPAENGMGLNRIASLPTFAVALIVAALLGAGLHARRDVPSDPAFNVAASAPLTADPTPAAGYRPAGEDWPSYGGDPGGRHYSALADLTPANVARLTVAWTFHVGMPDKQAKGSLELAPLKIGDTVYVCTPYNDVIAIDAATGRQRWRFDAHIAQKGYGRCRGVTYYKAPIPVSDCPERIITNTVDARLIALDARTGVPCRSFGTNGVTSLLAGMGKVVPGYYYVTSAPTLVRGKVVLGGWVTDNQYWGEPSGVIRAFDAVTGRFAWAFDAGRPDDHAEPKPGTTYTPSTPNSWAPMSADETLGLIYVPTGAPTPGYYGARRRPFDDRYSSSVVALDGATGAVRWRYQTVHHDLWDYDAPSQPTLIDLPVPGGVRHGLIQATKRGDVFVLDRVTGRPLTTVTERTVPMRSVAAGERLSPTQPFSVGMPSFRGPDLSETMMWGLTPIDQMICRIRFRQARSDGPFTPPGLDPAVVYPGNLGGTDWGGVAVDPRRQIMIIPSDRVANYDRLIARNVADQRGIKPNSKVTDLDGPLMAQGGTPFAATINPFLSPLGAPCQQPPYGMLSAVSLRSHQILWTRRLGTARDSGPLGLRSMLPIPMGTPLQGGSLITASGLVFIAATQERAFRAVDLASGRTLWEVRLPAGGQATPITYRAGGRQFVLVPAGGNTAIKSGLGDSIIAYALPGSSSEKGRSQ